jgi:pyruvate formate lyase activating enzyme
MDFPPEANRYEGLLNKMNITIKGFIKASLLDWDGKIVSTLYVPGCNMRCPYCQNAELILNPKQYPTISKEEIKNFYLQRKDFLDGICLTGGEPCLYGDLAEFLEDFKEIGAQVKLDTNGTYPEKIRETIGKNVVDYVAMDVKAPLNFESYKKSSGIKDEKLFSKVKESIRLIMNSKIDYEFRTTVVPSLHKEKDIVDIAKYLKGAKKYALQNFQNVNTLDKSFAEIEPYKREKLEKFAKKINPYINNVIIRGRN